MADVLTTSFSHSYNGREITSELFYQPEEEHWSVEQFYRVINTVDKTNIYLPQSLSKVLRKYTTCGFAATGGVTNILDKVISTEKIKANLEECADVFTDTIFAEAIRKGVEVHDLSNTIIDQIIQTQLTKGLRSDIHRICWFADSVDADADWNQFDGWIRRFVDASSDIGASCFVNLDTTAFETLDALATDGARDAMKQLWEASSKTLRAMNNRAYYVSCTVADNYQATLEDLGSSAGMMNLENGKTQLTFRGVPVIPVPGWDSFLADATNPWATGSGNTIEIGSNLIVLTVADNLVVGTDVNSPMNEFKVRSDDDDDEKMKITAKFKLGAQFVHPELVCMGY